MARGKSKDDHEAIESPDAEETANPAVDPVEYFNEVEGHFAARRGTPFVVSAKDWALMKSWHDAGVPLPVVIEAIDSVFEKNETSGRKKVISSLSYCRHAVKELWDERRELTVGDAEQVVEIAPAETIRALAEELEATENAVVRSFVPRLMQLARKRSVPAIEEALIGLEHELVESLAASLSVGDRAALQMEIAHALGDMSRVDETTRARTAEANLRRLLRERFVLPRLTLFR